MAQTDYRNRTNRRPQRQDRHDDRPRQSREEQRDIRRTAAQYVLDLARYATNPKAQADGEWDVLFLEKSDPLYKKWGATIEKHVVSKLEFLRKNEKTIYAVLYTWAMRTDQLGVVVRIFNLKPRDERNLRLYCFGIGLMARALKAKLAFSKGYAVKLFRQLKPNQVKVLKNKIREEFSYIIDDEQGEGSDDLLDIVDELDSIMDEDPGDKFVRWLLPDEEDPYVSPASSENGAKPADAKAPSDDLFEDATEDDASVGDLLVDEDEDTDLLGGEGSTADDGDLLRESGGTTEIKAKINPALEAAITFVRTHAAKDPKKAKGVATARKLLQQVEDGIKDEAEFLKSVTINKKVAGVK